MADTSDRPGSPMWHMTSMHPDAVAWRGEQAEVDADIEGLARDAGADELERRMDAEGVPLDEQRERLIAYFRGRGRELSAAE